ncbi:MAG: flagellar hook-basal body complex protein [Ruegeria sp.]
MDGAAYATLARQSGLLREMQVVANNIANATTTGYRGSELTFSEHIRGVGSGAVSMGHANVHVTQMQQGPLAETGGTFDLAIEGEGYFLVQTKAGSRLTRAGVFSPNGEGMLSTADGHLVLDTEEAPIFVPPSAATIFIAPDGTISSQDQPLGRVGVFVPTEAQGMQRETGVLFNAPAGYDPAPEARVLQGVLEGSNINPIEQIARMIEVQRAYEMGQSFLETEDERIRAAVRNLTK